MSMREFARNARQLYHYDLRTKAFCRDSPDSTSDNYARNIHETEARNVAFHLPISTRSIRQCACRQFHIRILVPRELCDVNYASLSSFCTKHFKAFRECLFAFLYPPERMISIFFSRKKFLRKLSCTRKR